MLKCTISGTAIALALAMTAQTPTAAQEVVSDPGNCAFFHPYANCQNKGPGNPDTDPYFRRGLVVSQAPWPMVTTIGAARREPHYHSEAMKRWE
ncbi:hypothetical protein [Bradyrhizobium sp.]|uniref:hypothetical protein n=1 Tax=Bradyrhizobium sp. TaxID=376 RepID=UPI001EBB14AE|nr:hypothetical protein [Bradyrhizobium sp.]MBV8917039.1 hypothetical protein [Bradyrhizobium sp.]MBV9983745.1 hypothetical protein [Bradyrhizobium sp.]